MLKTLALAAMLPLPGAALRVAQPAADQPLAGERAPSELRLKWAPAGQPPRTYRARIDRPGAETDRGGAVFMFGGGLVNDLDWTTPGRFEHNGQPAQLTITGEDAIDGVTIARALVADGWTVIRYSSLREGDPLHAQSRGMAESLPFDATVDLARFMWGQLLKEAAVAPERTVVLGHSLGTARGVIASGGRAMGYVSLAGAYMSPTASRPSHLAAEAMASAGEAGADGTLSEEEFEASAPDLEFAAVDVDGSGAVSGWELAAAQRLRGGVEAESDRLSRGGGDWPWPTDLIAMAQPPVLAVWGGLDTMSYHGPLLEALGARGGYAVTTRWLADLGHNLGPLDEGRTGPISPEAVDAIVAWLDDVFPR